MNPSPVLSIDRLSLEFPVYRGAIHALNGVTLSVGAGEIVGIVGESGSGKSVTAMMAMRLLPATSYRVTAGSLHVLGHDMLTVSERTLSALRGADVAMIFQEPMTALNPTRRIGAAMVEVIRCHRRLSAHDARAHAIALLEDMHIADAAGVLERYPFELSGGMRQRILIALAFSCNPRLLIADEPTTALDVTVQRQVLLLLRERARALGTGVLFISHDMAVVSQLCDRVYVMYAGSVVESGPTADILVRPAHPYTRGLLLGLPESAAPHTPLHTIPGTVPDLSRALCGCPFAARCPDVGPACTLKPELSTAAARAVACHYVHHPEPVA
ncbi:ABC transporter ATP-binding protein [Paludibacterium yongneupense]|uniref:ABC transporter ATP-binding protein n=1 Tax=Paludibacterium yongneupense TaxID=400061 RepID=UPI00042641F1|nr:ABC transporter ATP-binding protein [Paludibacterium yongneupense]